MIVIMKYHVFLFIAFNTLALFLQQERWETSLCSTIFVLIALNILHYFCRSRSGRGFYAVRYLC